MPGLHVGAFYRGGGLGEGDLWVAFREGQVAGVMWISRNVGSASAWPQWRGTPNRNVV